MTIYYVELVTYKTGMTMRFEFKSIDARFAFVVSFINSLKDDHIHNVAYGHVVKSI